jgi:glycosyltransferase involved in cell wall biosynthesis
MEYFDLGKFQLSVVIHPVYNERETVAAILRRVRAVPIPKEIVVVDDGSTDGAEDYLRSVRNEKEKGNRFVVLFHDKNQGKGAALRSGFAHTTGSVVAVQNGDLEYYPTEYQNLLKLIIADDADIVYGPGFVGGEAHRVHLFWHYMGKRFMTFFSNGMTHLSLTDMEAGVRVFRKEVLDSIPMKSNRFNFEWELTAEVAEGKWRMYEVLVSYLGRDYTLGKKIKWKNGFHGISAIFRVRFFNGWHGDSL